MAFELLLYLLSASFLVFYLVLIFQFYEKDSHFGPFKSSKRKIIYIERDPAGEIVNRHEQPVTFFDWVRRFFGVYRIEKEECQEAAEGFDLGCEDGEVWFVKQERMEVWECSTCLSGWMALLPAIGALFMFPFVWSILVWGLVAGVSSFLHTRLYAGEVSVKYFPDDTEEGTHGADYA